MSNVYVLIDAGDIAMYSYRIRTLIKDAERWLDDDETVEWRTEGEYVWGTLFSESHGEYRHAFLIRPIVIYP